METKAKNEGESLEATMKPDPSGNIAYYYIFFTSRLMLAVHPENMKPDAVGHVRFNGVWNNILQINEDGEYDAEDVLLIAEFASGKVLEECKKLLDPEGKYD